MKTATCLMSKFGDYRDTRMSVSSMLCDENRYIEGITEFPTELIARSLFKMNTFTLSFIDRWNSKYTKYKIIDGDIFVYYLSEHSENGIFINLYMIRFGECTGIPECVYFEIWKLDDGAAVEDFVREYKGNQTTVKKS